MILSHVKMAFKFWSIKSKVDDRSLHRNFAFKLKQNSYIYSTYTLPSRGTNLHAKNGRGKMEWSCQKLRLFQKINYSLLVWTLYLYAHCSACLYFCTGKNSLHYFCPQFVMHWSAMNANLMKVTSSGINHLRYQ